MSRKKRILSRINKFYVGYRAMKYADFYRRLLNIGEAG